MHWTAGHYKPSGLDKTHYHFLVDGEGNVVTGFFPVKANLSPLDKDGGYAAHTLKCNSDSIGVALAAMAGAVEQPFSTGKAAITEKQLAAFVKLVYDISVQYSIPITPETILTHAEVQPNLGIAQRGKWDITWLPGMAAPDAARKVGDILRSMVKDAKPSLTKALLQKLGVMK